MGTEARDLPAELLAGLLRLATEPASVGGLLEVAAQLCHDVAGCRAVGIYEEAGEGLALTAHCGDNTLASTLPLPAGWPVDSGWQRSDGDRLDLAVTADSVPVALLATVGATDPAYVLRIAAGLSQAVARRATEDRLAATVRHLVAAQRISQVGSYDFDIATNTNVWSDQLYRIYGREPQSFMATYETFLGLLHADDRDRIVAVHQEALATLSTYEMDERIVWPNGEVRTLASWGEVVAGPDGTPARMVGICWDITEQKATALALSRSSERFEALIQSSPDVILVVAADGTVTQANDRVLELLGWHPTEVVGTPVSELLPGGLTAGGPPHEATACTRDGRLLPVEVSTSVIETDDGTVSASFVRDMRDRKHSEDLAMRLHDTGVRRRHALEINDNVVQGLASVLYLLDLERHESAHAAARRTMAAARTMMNDLLEGAGPAKPGELVREQGHALTLQEVVPPQPPAAPGALRIVLADDAEDIRLLLRLTLSTSDSFDVVGEASNGREAVTLVGEHRPDVILLDLSMPVMDGLQAIPEITELSPDTKIIVLSGFDEDRMRPVALELGAHGYLEKGEATTGVFAMLAELFPGRGLAVVLAEPADPQDSPEAFAFDGDMVVHQLRTPLTVITGMLSTLRDRIDSLPSATTREMVDAAGRNARQMADLLDAISDARRASTGQLHLAPEPTDLARLVRAAVADSAAAHDAPTPTVVCEGRVEAAVDPARIRQVLSNLLTNAVTFAPGASVTVTVAIVGGFAEVVVADDGPGVPSERREELFEKFGRLGKAGHGMGLGLYISRAIARAHGGDLVLREGPGATFALTLPLTAAAEVPADGAIR